MAKTAAAAREGCGGSTILVPHTRPLLIDLLTRLVVRTLPGCSCKALNFEQAAHWVILQTSLSSAMVVHITGVPSVPAVFFVSAAHGHTQVNRKECIEWEPNRGTLLQLQYFV